MICKKIHGKDRAMPLHQLTRLKDLPKANFKPRLVCALQPRSAPSKFWQHLQQVEYNAPGLHSQLPQNSVNMMFFAFGNLIYSTSYPENFATLLDLAAGASNSFMLQHIIWRLSLEPSCTTLERLHTDLLSTL